MTKQTTTRDIQDAVRAISEAASEAVKTISSAAAEARSVVATNAAEAARTLVLNNAGDHDLLQRVDQKVDALIVTVDKISEKDNLYVLKDEFIFWRNLIVGGLLLTIAVGVISNFLK